MSGAIFLLSVLCLSSCAVGLSEPEQGPMFESAVGSTSEGVLGGWTTDRYPAVGLLRWGGKKCTATLIGSSSLLTAAHCLDDLHVTVFVVDEKPLGRGRNHNFVVHPAYDEETFAYDLAVVRLEEPIPHSALAPMRVEDVELQVGDLFRGLGYGNTATGSGDSARKMFSNRITDVSDRFYSYNPIRGTSAGCNGDSGSPLLTRVDDEMVIAGVYSNIAFDAGHDDDYCETGVHRYHRVDSQSGLGLRTWLESAVGTDWCHDDAWMGPRYCSRACPCDRGQGDCDSDAECSEGLVCRQNVGEQYGATRLTDVCESPG